MHKLVNEPSDEQHVFDNRMTEHIDVHSSICRRAIREMNTIDFAQPRIRKSKHVAIGIRSEKTIGLQCLFICVISMK